MNPHSCLGAMIASSDSETFKQFHGKTLTQLLKTDPISNYNKTPLHDVDIDIMHVKEIVKQSGNMLKFIVSSSYQNNLKSMSTIKQ